jgi:hypothetical protein
MSETGSAQCDFSQVVPSAILEEAILVPFQQNCTSNIAYGDAYDLSPMERVCSMTPVSQRFLSMSMDACKTPTVGVEQLCVTASGFQGDSTGATRYCTVSGVVAGDMTRYATSKPEYTYVNMECMPVCLPSECQDDEAILNYVTNTLLPESIQQQGLYPAVPMSEMSIGVSVQCYDDITAPDAFESPVAVYSSVNVSPAVPPQVYEIGSIVVVAVTISCLVLFLVTVLFPKILLAKLRPNQACCDANVASPQHSENAGASRDKLGDAVFPSKACPVNASPRGDEYLDVTVGHDNDIEVGENVDVPSHETES